MSLLQVRAAAAGGAVSCPARLIGRQGGGGGEPALTRPPAPALKALRESRRRSLWGAVRSRPVRFIARHTAALPLWSSPFTPHPNLRATSPHTSSQKLDAKEPVTVLITGAAGQIAYKCVPRRGGLASRMGLFAARGARHLACGRHFVSPSRRDAAPSHPIPHRPRSPPLPCSLIFLVARGDMLGADQPIVLHLLDIAPMEAKLAVRAAAASAAAAGQWRCRRCAPARRAPWCSWSAYPACFLDRP